MPPLPAIVTSAFGQYTAYRVSPLPATLTAPVTVSSHRMRKLPGEPPALMLPLPVRDRLVLMMMTICLVASYVELDGFTASMPLPEVFKVSMTYVPGENVSVPLVTF